MKLKRAIALCAALELVCGSVAGSGARISRRSREVHIAAPLRPEHHLSAAAGGEAASATSRTKGSR